jgi:eukaryotic-like serine/threonine-protein kinase
MGEVYRAHDTRLHRDVAIKVLHHTVSADREHLSRFAREARLLASLNHPNIGGIYGVETADGSDALILELVEGATLAEMLADGPLAVPDAVRMARQIALALQAAHDRGVVHRDLKPANIKVTPAGQIKVLDFGLAKALETADGRGGASELSTTAAVTSPGVLYGTMAYMSPERARGGASGRAADIWAFGCVLYEMLTSERAFKGRTGPDTLAAVLTGGIDLHLLPRDTPASVRRLLRRCLERDPARRLRDFGDACLELDEAAGADELPGETAPLTNRAGRYRAAALVLAVVAIGAAGVITINRPSAPPVLRKFDLMIPDLPRAPGAYPKISPDGRHLAYPAAGKLWVRDLATLGSRPVVEDLPILFFWSPDSRQIAFAVGERLMRVPSDGGAPMLVATLPGLFGSSGWGGTWTVDGRIVIAQAGGGAALLAVAATGGTVTPIVEPERGDLHEPAALPGNVILFGVHIGNVEAIAAYDGNRTREVLRMDGEVLRFPTYSPTGHLLYERTLASPGIWAIRFNLQTLTTSGEPFLVVAGGTAPSVAADGTLSYLAPGDSVSTLAWIDRDGSISPVMPSLDAGLSHPALSPDGTRIAATLTRQGEPSAIAVFDISGRRHWRVTAGTEPESLPFWLDDGRSVGFSVQPPNGTARLVSAPADGSRTPAVLAENASWGTASMDAKQVLFLRPPASEQPGSDLWHRGADGRWATVVTADAGVALSPQVSPDGRLLAYMGFNAGSFDVYLRQFPEGDGQWRVSTRSGVFPRWSRRGDRLYYIESPGRLMEVDITSGPPVTMGRPRPALAREPQDVLHNAGFDVSADGTRFLAVARMAAGRPPAIVIVQNWALEFGARQP